MSKATGLAAHREWLAAEAALLDAPRRVVMQMCMDILAYNIEMARLQSRQQHEIEIRKAEFQHLLGKA